VRQADGTDQALREYGLKPGMKLFLGNQEITKSKGFGTFKVAAKWNRTDRGFKTQESWSILTNFSELDIAIEA